MMRLGWAVGWCCALLLGSLVGASAGDEEAPPGAAEQAVMEALAAEATPEFVKAVVQGGAGARESADALAAQPVAAARVAAALLARCKAIAERDGDASVALADWILDLARAARKAAPKDPRVTEALWRANLARGRIGLARDKGVEARHWTDAADGLLDAQDDKPANEARDQAHVMALGTLREPAKAPSAPLVTLVEHSGHVCARLLKSAADREDVRLAVVASYEWQVDASQPGSRKAMQAALNGYFEAFAPLASVDGAHREYVLRWNQMVSRLRAEKLDVKVDYLARRVVVALGELSVDLPRTDHWQGGATSISESFRNPDTYRTLEFTVYRWDHLYKFRGSVRDVGGDNIKGLAGRSFDAAIESLTEGSGPRRIKKKHAPSRKRINEQLPAGIEYTLEYEGKGGRMLRTRSFFVKSVKAERTIEITILESADVPEVDPEWDDVVDSFDVTKKER